MSMDWFSRSDEDKTYDECVCLYLVSALVCTHVVSILWCIGTLTAQHVVICVVCDGVDVRRRLRAAFALVGGDHRGRVDGQPFVRIHRHTEEPGVGLRKQERFYTFHLYLFILTFYFFASFISL